MKNFSDYHVDFHLCRIPSGHLNCSSIINYSSLSGFSRGLVRDVDSSCFLSDFRTVLFDELSTSKSFLRQRQKDLYFLFHLEAKQNHKVIFKANLIIMQFLFQNNIRKARFSRSFFYQGNQDPRRLGYRECCRCIET